MSLNLLPISPKKTTEMLIICSGVDGTQVQLWCYRTRISENGLRGFIVGVWLTRPSNKNGPRANKAGEDALCCMLTVHWLCRGFDYVLAPRLSGSGSYGCWCGASGEGGLHPWPVCPKSVDRQCMWIERNMNIVFWDTLLRRWGTHNFRSAISLDETPPRILKPRFSFGSAAAIITSPCT